MTKTQTTTPETITDEQMWTIRDPFAGALTITGRTLAEAVADAYADVQADERPAYVWFGDEQIAVPGGTCRPTQ